MEEGPCDYIIVGSGLGGLTTASLLSQAGYRCLVLEQHDVAGGATHTFEVQGYEWDVGFHYIGENVDKWWSPVRKLFDIASGGRVEGTFEALDDLNVRVSSFQGRVLPS